MELDLTAALGLSVAPDAVMGRVELGHPEWKSAVLTRLVLAEERGVLEVRLTFCAERTRVPHPRPDRDPPPPEVVPTVVVHLPPARPDLQDPRNLRPWLVQAVRARFAPVLPPAPSTLLSSPPGPPPARTRPL